MENNNYMFGNVDQWIELVEWIKENKPEFADSVFSFAQAAGSGSGDYRQIAQFTEDQDKWLYENCPLEFVQKRLNEKGETDGK